MHLKAHVLISDFSICLDSAIKHYEWNLDDIAFSSEERSLSSHWLGILGTKNVGRFALNSICQNIAIEKRSSSWKYIFAMLGTLAFILAAMIVAYILTTQYALKKRKVHTVMHTLPDSIVCLLQPPPSARAAQKDPLLEPIC
jgi:hypothetical protein